jgi:hypothetical protein
MAKIADTVFEGLSAVEIATEALVCTIVTCCGPRIARLARPGGRNLLLWKPATYTRGEWDLRGGHRVWATRPLADENEDTYATDNLPCTVERIPDGVRVLGGENPVSRIRRGFEVTVTGPDSLRVDNILRNTGDMLYSGGVWALTCSVPAAGTRYVIPIGDGSSWDAFRMVYFRTWAGHGQGGFADDQIRVLPDRVLITPAGVENKRMVESAAGILAMSDPGEGLTFVKRSPLQVERAAAPHVHRHRSQSEPLRRPCCCAKTTARAGAPSSAPWPTCPRCRRRRSPPCAPCSRANALVGAADYFVVEQSLPCGHVRAVKGTMERLGMSELIASKPCRERDLVLAMIAQRIVRPDSKLGTAARFADTTLADGLLRVEDADEDDLYAAMDWVLERQPFIEKKLAQRHLSAGGVCSTICRAVPTTVRIVRWRRGATTATG